MYSHHNEKKKNDFNALTRTHMMPAARFMLQREARRATAHHSLLVTSPNMLHYEVLHYGATAENAFQLATADCKRSNLIASYC